MPQNFIATVAIEILLNFFCVFLSPILMAGNQEDLLPGRIHQRMSPYL